MCAASICLLRAIHGVDELSVEVTSKDVAEHVELAVRQQRIVPLALCLALGTRGQPAGKLVPFATALALSDEEPICRKLVMLLLKL